MSEPRAGVATEPAAAPPPIVVGYSATTEGRAALTRAVAEAELRRAGLIVVHAAPEEELAALRAELDTSGVRYDVRGPAEAQDMAEDLLEAADSTGAELIVIGLRRRSPVGKLLLGSNAQRVLLDASCPVLSVKASAD